LPCQPGKRGYTVAAMKNSPKELIV